MMGRSTYCENFINNQIKKEKKFIFHNHTLKYEDVTVRRCALRVVQTTFALSCLCLRRSWVDAVKKPHTEHACIDTSRRPWIGVVGGRAGRASTEATRSETYAPSSSLVARLCVLDVCERQFGSTRPHSLQHSAPMSKLRSRPKPFKRSSRASWDSSPRCTWTSSWSASLALKQ